MVEVTTNPSERQVDSFQLEIEDINTRIFGESLRSITSMSFDVTDSNYLRTSKNAERIGREKPFDVESSIQRPSNPTNFLNFGDPEIFGKIYNQSETEESKGAKGELYPAPCLSLRHVQTHSEILPHLLISTTGAGLLEEKELLKEANIKFVVNCCEQGTRRGSLGSHLDTEDDFQVVNLDLKDESKQELNVAFEQFFPLVQQAKEEGKKCLICCHSGMSRSVSLVLAYLLAYESMSLIDALTHVKERRSVASPNPGFMAQLIQLERKLTEGVTIDLDRYKNDRFGDPLSFALEIRASYEEEEDVTLDGENTGMGKEKAKRPVHRKGTFSFSLLPQGDELNDKSSKQGNRSHKRIQSDVSFVFYQEKETEMEEEHRRSESDFNFIFHQGSPLSEKNLNHRPNGLSSDTTSKAATEKEEKKRPKHKKGTFSFSLMPQEMLLDEDKENGKPRKAHQRGHSDVSVFILQGGDGGNRKGHRRSGSDVSIVFRGGSRGHRRLRSDFSITVKKSMSQKAPNDFKSHERSTSDFSGLLHKVFEEGEDTEEGCSPKVCPLERDMVASLREDKGDGGEPADHANHVSKPPISDVSVLLHKVFEVEKGGQEAKVLAAKRGENTFEEDIGMGTNSGTSHVLFSSEDPSSTPTVLVQLLEEVAEFVSSIMTCTTALDMAASIRRLKADESFSQNHLVRDSQGAKL